MVRLVFHLQNFLTFMDTSYLKELTAAESEMNPIGDAFFMEVMIDEEEEASCTPQ